MTTMIAGAMAKLPQKAWALLWIAEGGDPSKADEASAVVMAESGGDSKAHTPGSCCYGGYQFHKDYFSVRCALSPPCATRMAIKLSNNGTSWDDGKWEAHENGSYQQFLGKSNVNSSTRRKDLGSHSKMASFNPFDYLPQGPVAGDVAEGLFNLGEETVGPAINEAGTGILSENNPLDALRNISAFFVGAGELLLTPEGWLRLGKLLGGAFMILWGLRIITKEATGSDPVGTAGKLGAAAATVATVK